MTVTLRYDFDILDLNPEHESGAESLDRLMARAGLKADHEDTRVALFRDPRTAKALVAAPKPLRDYFLASGFGLTSYHSGAATGFYPARDEAARLSVIRRLTQNVDLFDLPSPDDYPEAGEVFRLGDFLHQLSLALPEEVTPPPRHQLAPRQGSAGGAAMPLLLLR